MELAHLDSLVMWTEVRLSYRADSITGQRSQADEDGHCFLAQASGARLATLDEKIPALTLSQGSG